VVTERISAEQTRAIPVSRPDNVDTEVATEQLNARGKTGGGVSAADLLRREGRV
jgi:RND superfamily putative drug exporter